MVVLQVRKQISFSSLGQHGLSPGRSKQSMPAYGPFQRVERADDISGDVPVAFAVGAEIEDVAGECWTTVACRAAFLTLTLVGGNVEEPIRFSRT
jgi:hypothetical protein